MLARGNENPNVTAQASADVWTRFAFGARTAMERRDITDAATTAKPVQIVAGRTER